MNRSEEPGGPARWAKLRDVQDHVDRTVKGSDLALAIDRGDATDMHPRDKRETGERHALCALAECSIAGKDLKCARA